MNRPGTLTISTEENNVEALTVTSPLQAEMAEIDKLIDRLEGRLKRIRSISESSQKSLDKSNYSVSPDENNFTPQFLRQNSCRGENDPVTDDHIAKLIPGAEDNYSRNNSKLEPVPEDVAAAEPRHFSRSVSFTKKKLIQNGISAKTPEENEIFQMRTRKISCSSCGKPNEISAENRKSTSLSQESQTSETKIDISSENALYPSLKPLLNNAENLELHTQNSYSSEKSVQLQAKIIFKFSKYKSYIFGIIILVLLIGILPGVYVQLNGSNEKTHLIEAAASQLVNSPPTHQILCTPLKKMDNGNAKCDAMNSKCNITCDKGYELKHKLQTQILCGQDGNWNQNNTCIKRHCENTYGKNGKIVCKKSMCKITCNNGHIVEGDDEAQCFNGELYPELRCQKQTCGKPEPPEYSWPLKASWTDGSKCHQEMYYYNDRCFTDCKWGRKDETKTTISCQSDGTWTKEAQCNPPTRFCDELPKSEHSINCIGRHLCKEKSGDVCIRRSYEPETSCRLECRNNQISDPVFCLDNGSWNKEKLDEKTCTETCEQISIKESFFSCNSSEETKGIPKHTVCKVWCYAGYQMKKNAQKVLQPLQLQCNNGGTWNTSWSLFTCDEMAVMLIGGESHGREVSTVEVFPFGKNEITHLPCPLRWGSSGLIDEKVFFCGGEIDGLQSSDCYKLSQGKWINITQLSSGGSKSAYAGVHNSLVIFNGYTASKIQDWTTSTIQYITESGTKILDENDTFSAVQSSAAILPDGCVIVTGGRKRERKATMFTFTIGSQNLIESISQKTPLPDMNVGRMGHASTYMVLREGNECTSSMNLAKCGERRKLIVAGGWNERRGFISSVELYDLDKGNKWIYLKQHHMPQRRTDFALVAIKGKLTAIGGFYIQVVGKKKVQVYPPIIQLGVGGREWRWTNATNMTMALPRSGFSITEIPMLKKY